MKHYNISVDDMMSMLSDVEDSKPKKANKKTEKKTEKKETETETDKKD